MFQRNGENPDTVIIAAAPFCNEAVKQAIAKIESAITLSCSDIVHISQNSVELQSGEVITFEDHTLALSLIYRTAVARVMVMEMHDPERVTFH